MILLIIIIILLIIIFLILVIFVLKNKLDKSKKENIEQDKTNNVTNNIEQDKTNIVTNNIEQDKINIVTNNIEQDNMDNNTNKAKQELRNGIKIDIGEAKIGTYNITEGGFCLETVYNLGEMSNILYKAVYIENHPNGEYYINNNRGIDPKADYTENKIVLTFFHLLILKAFQ